MTVLKYFACAFDRRCGNLVYQEMEIPKILLFSCFVRSSIVEILIILTKSHGKRDIIATPMFEDKNSSQVKLMVFHNGLDVLAVIVSCK